MVSSIAFITTVAAASCAPAADRAFVLDAAALAAPACPDPAPSAPVRRPACRYAAEIAGAARAHGVPAAFAIAIARAESGCRHRGVESPKGAIGLMQVMPTTGARFGARDLTDLEQNLSASMRYLAFLRRKFAGDPILVAAAYNAGEGAVDRYAGVPPYAETRAYVARVTALLEADPHFGAPAPPMTGAAAPTGAAADGHEASDLARLPVRAVADPVFVLSFPHNPNDYSAPE